MSPWKRNFSGVPVTRVRILESNENSSSAYVTCKLGQDIEFSTAGLETYCMANWEPLVFDALLIAAAIDFCDNVRSRPALGWARSFEVYVPVHEPRRWQNDVEAELVDALQFLTGDHWKFSFRGRRTDEINKCQRNFDLPDPSSAILPYSDGLDSLAISGLTLHAGKQLIPVRLGSKKGRSQPFAAVPYKVRFRRGERRESSGRSRGFTFAMLSGIAAYLAKSPEIILPESGQGALGPPLLTVGHAGSDFRNNPLFTDKMELLLVALFGHKVRFSFPRLWYTKGETLREYLNIGGDGLHQTRSCWQNSRQVSVNKKLRQCGICAACMLRRLSMHAAGIREPDETYVWENLGARSFEEGAAAGFSKITKALREHAIAGVLHLDHLAGLQRSGLHASTLRHHAFQLSASLNLTLAETEERLDRLLCQHRSEWQSFIKSLGSEAFVHSWARAGE